MLSAPCYQRVGERRIDQKIKIFERQTHNTSPLEEIYHGFSTSSIALVKDQKTQKKYFYQ